MFKKVRGKEEPKSDNGKMSIQYSMALQLACFLSAPSISMCFGLRHPCRGNTMDLIGCYHLSVGTRILIKVLTY